MYPKQFLPLTGDRTMLQETATRLEGMNNVTDRLLVVCNDAHRFLVAEQLRALDIPARIVLEPEGRNTAPAVALAAILALQDTPAGETPPLLLIMPADHMVRDRAAFLKAVAVGEAAANDGKVVAFGVVPTYPHTGYGYIQAGAVSLIAEPITAFVEKPDKATAVGLLETNRFFWNAGIFLFRADVLIEQLNQFAPDIVASCLKAIELATEDSDFLRPDAEAFCACPADSIDYALMEKTTNASVVPLDAGWSDIGSWAALHDISAKDEQGNAIFGDVIAHECQNSYITSKSRLVTAIGLSDFVIVEDKDTVLVAHKDRSQDVQALVDVLKRQGRSETELHRHVFRPWGSYDSIDSDNGFQVKRLIVNPGAVLSLQKHARRAEHWTVVRGVAHITLDDKEFDLNVNESTYIPIGAVHRIANHGAEPAHGIEVQCGEYLGEDDIVRLEDEYGRQRTTT
jgi:mannose-1-phosphate guanylyltransferase/mannose-6-phosphate isomerase